MLWDELGSPIDAPIDTSSGERFTPTRHSLTRSWRSPVVTLNSREVIPTGRRSRAFFKGHSRTREVPAPFSLGNEDTHTTTTNSGKKRAGPKEIVRKAALPIGGPALLISGLLAGVGQNRTHGVTDRQHRGDGERHEFRVRQYILVRSLLVVIFADSEPTRSINPCVVGQLPRCRPSLPEFIHKALDIVLLQM